MCSSAACAVFPTFAAAQEVTSRNTTENSSRKELKALELLSPVLSKSEKKEIKELQKQFQDRKAERTRYGVALLSYNGDESLNNIKAALRVGVDAISREPKPSVEFVLKW